jgi:hypothetical protein
MRIRRLLLALLLASCSRGATSGPDATGSGDAATDAPPPADAMDESLVYAHSGNHLYRIDTRTNASVDIGPITGVGTQSITDIAVDKDGKMVGITLDKLYAIDVHTGAATLIKDLTAAAKSQNFTSLSYVPTDFNDPQSAEKLVAASTQGAVYEIDPASGDATMIGTYGTAAGNAQIGSSGDIVAVRGLGILATVNVGTKLTDPDYLATVDPTTRHATPLAQTTGYDRIFGLAYWKGTVYGFVDDAAMPSTQGALISIDPKTGAATKLKDDPIGWFGAGVTTNAPVIVN